MTKKGMELSLNVVIIAIILLIVLIVVVFIFVQRSSIFGKSLEGPSCIDRGGTCSQGKACDPDRYLIYAKGCDEKGNTNAEKTGPCCVLYPK